MSYVYTCDKCNKPINDVIYELNTRYDHSSYNVQSQSHYHWGCLLAWVKENSQ